MDQKAQDNYYLLLDLDPSIDEWDTIKVRLVEKQREWGRHAVHGSPARQQEAKINLRRIDQMRKDLQDPDIRKTIRADARKIQTAREVAGRRRLDEHVELLRTKGFYKEEDLRRLHQDLGGDLPESTIEEILKRSGLAMAVAPDSRAGSGVPARPRISPTVQGEIRRLLDQLKLKTLYDLLEMSRRTDLATLSRRSDEVYRHYRPLTDPDSTARSKLAGHAKNIFSDAAEKHKYDNTIDVEAMHRLHGLIDTAGLSGLISSDVLDRLVRLAIERGVKPDDARSYIEEYATRKKWLMQPIGQLPSEDLKLCGFCSTLARSRSDTNCPSCHEPLEVSCPRCGADTPTDRERCGSCGFPTGNIPLLQALLRSGRRLIEERKFKEAIERLDRALQIYDEWGPARIERERASSALKTIEAAEREIQALVDSGRIMHASQTLAGLEQKWGLEPWVSVRSRVEKRLSLARALLGEGKRLLGGSDSEAAWAKFDEALAVSGDLDEARDAKANCPPPPPVALEVRELQSGFGLAWSAPATGGVISFRILRKEGSVPRDPDDGTVLQRQGAPGIARAEDGEAAAGRPWHYAVFSVRDGLVSRQAAVAGPVIRTSEVEGLHASIGDGRVMLSWQVPAGAQHVIVRRRPETVDDAHAWDPPLTLSRSDSRFTDAGLENEVTYRYRVAAVFPGPDGGEVTTAGRDIVATPSAPPGRVVDITVKRDRFGLEISWKHLDDPAPTVVVGRSAERPTWEIGQILPLSSLSTLGRCLAEVREEVARDPAPDPSEPHYPVFATNRLLAIYCGAAQFVEVRNLYATREDGHIVLRWEWPDGCEKVEVSYSPNGQKGTVGDEPLLVVERARHEHAGLVRLPVEGLATGWRIFRVRCISDPGESGRVAGSGQTVDALVVRARELRWALRRRHFGLGVTQLVVETEDLIGIERLRLVGKINERPMSPDDGICLLDWRPIGQATACASLVLPVKARGDRRGETFCRLFIEPADLIHIDDPPVDRTVL